MISIFAARYTGSRRSWAWIVLLALIPALAACQTTLPGLGGPKPDPVATEPPKPLEPEAQEEESAEEVAETRIVIPSAVLNEDPFLLDDIAGGADKPGAQIAFLAPLSGRHAGAGQALYEGAQMSLFDMRNPAASLIPFDTKGTPDGAREAAAKAIAAGADIVLGPLLSPSVDAAAPVARRAGVNMLSFSNNPSVAGAGVYVLGFSPAEQVRSIVDTAAQEGRERFAVLAPAGAYGQLVIDTVQATVAQYRARMTHVRFFDPQATDYGEMIIDISNYDARRQALIREQRQLADKTDEASKRALRRLEELDTLGDPPFDAILVAATSNVSLRTLAAQLAYYDVDQPAVRVLGMQLWDEFPRLYTEPSLIGSWYPAPSGALLDRFRDRYQAFYGRGPLRLASLGYDAMALAAVLAGDGNDPQYDARALTNPQGFLGVDGLFRLLPQGVAQRSYAIQEITGAGVDTIKPALTTFQPVVN